MRVPRLVRNLPTTKFARSVQNVALPVQNVVITAASRNAAKLLGWFGHPSEFSKPTLKPRLRSNCFCRLGYLLVSPYFRTNRALTKEPGSPCPCLRDWGGQMRPGFPCRAHNPNSERSSQSGRQAPLFPQSDRPHVCRRNHERPRP